MITFLQYCVNLFVRPQATLRALAGDRRRLFFGLLGQLILAGVYCAGISLALAIGVMHVPRLLVLNIPASQYYFYERFFIWPVALAGTILSSGIIRLVARVWDGKGQYEDLFALLGFSMIVIAVVMGLPDLAIGLLAGMGMITPPGFAYIGPHVWLGTVWYLFLVILSVREVERLSWGKTVVLAAIGFVVNGMVQFIFIR